MLTSPFNAGGIFKLKMCREHSHATLNLSEIRTTGNDQGRSDFILDKVVPYKTRMLPECGGQRQPEVLVRCTVTCVSASDIVA